MKEQCNDCGRMLTPENTNKQGFRHDICTECYSMRGKVLEAVKNGIITLDQFSRVQKAMRGRSHSAYSLSRTLLKDPL